MESHVKFAEAEKTKGRRPSVDTAGRPLFGQDGPSDATHDRDRAGQGSTHGTTKGETQKNSVYFRASLPAAQRPSRHDVSNGGRSSVPARAAQGRASTKSISNVASRSRKSLGPRTSEVIPNARLNAPDMKRSLTDQHHEGAFSSSFDASELKMLGRRFRKLDQNNDGNLTLQEFMSIPELQSNPLVSRVIKIFDLDGNGLVSFNEFVNGMSVFSGAADRISTLRFAFKVYDMDKDGYISNGELFQVLRMMVGDNLGDVELQQVVDKTILYGDHDGDGKISFKEFCSMIGEIGIDQKMVLLNL